MSQDRECRAEQDVPVVAAPDLPYLPRDPEGYRPVIGLIGCGGIAPYHLRAYRKAGYRVAALCDIAAARADELRNEHYPDGICTTDYREVLARSDVDVVDITTHPSERTAIITDALRAGKHVLSQKPFVTDIDEGRRLVGLAEECGRKLAVNQNGRWAPHFSYMRHAVDAGLIGDVTAIHLALRWDHNWTADTPFNDVKHLILYDFAIHWFDIVTCFMGDRKPLSIFASTAHSPAQRAKPYLLAQVQIEYDGALVSLSFDADTRHGAEDRSVVVGTKGTLVSFGPDLNTQTVTLQTADGIATPTLEGDWFTNGFHGTMTELLCAIEENREPYNSARHNLRSLALCFAAVASAEQRQPIAPGTVLRLPGT
ncbi:MAG: Gfo/Idh/MocA family oxidoreductase [Candidatus Hydrogenedentes bacterium]|nr:Gfo/Idh/MocA family oxidoreductase [Candidatus Hydrogenedentota bacterium]